MSNPQPSTLNPRSISYNTFHCPSESTRFEPRICAAGIHTDALNTFVAAAHCGYKFRLSDISQNLIIFAHRAPPTDMLSNPLHRYSTYNALPSSGMLSTGLSSHHMHTQGLDTLAHGSQYALQQLQQNIELHQSRNKVQRQHPYGGRSSGNGRSSAHATGSNGPVRRRISRACDQCNQLRTKCDGQSPCAHCVGEQYFVIAEKSIFLMTDRIWPRLRICQRTQEARQSFSKGSCSAASCCGRYCFSNSWIPR